MMHTCLGGQSFTIEKTCFMAGRHHLDIIVIGPAVDEGPRGPRAIKLLREPYQFKIRCK